MRKAKIVNDPIHGFINLPYGLVLDIVDHPYFQRLRRIKQLGLTDYVYPGALHTRFHHAIGAMHLMGVALDTLRDKGHNISDEECEAAQVAALCHDLGHGPFSHTLETSFIQGIAHEQISLMLMQRLNNQLGGRMDMAIAIFDGSYPRPFFHELVSSQLDVDRLDYLKRDSFFTGVIEGGVGASRILKMLDLVDERIVVEEKGIYSIEHFLSARRLMYWQVYLHKSVLAVENMLVLIMQRARYLSMRQYDVPMPTYIRLFLERNITHQEFVGHPEFLEPYLMLDDFDLWTCVKTWMSHPDAVLSRLCRDMIQRRIYRIALSHTPFPKELEQRIELGLFEQMGIIEEDLPFYLMKGSVTNAAYLSGGQSIKILKKDGQIIEMAEASDLENIKAMGEVVRKYYLCWHKDLYLEVF